MPLEILILYMKSEAICANVSVEKYARKSTENDRQLENIYHASYDRDRDGKYYCTEQDAAVEVLMEEQVKTRLSSYFNKFVRQIAREPGSQTDFSRHINMSMPPEMRRGR